MTTTKDNRVYGWNRRFRLPELLLLLAATLYAQGPKELMDRYPPKTPAVTIEYTNPFDQSKGEALVEVPAGRKGPMPLIVTPHAANWTQETNRPLWSGVAEEYGAIILYPRHQGKVNPRVSMGSAKQLANIQAAIDETERRYQVDKSRVYIAGLSQGAVETLLMAGHHPRQFAGAMAINPVADFLAFYDDLSPEAVAKTPDPPLRKLREGQWAALRNMMLSDLGGTPDTARADYYLRSAVVFARELATVPLILMWADDDELIPNGATHQGGMLAQMIRSFHPTALHEMKHSGGHGWPFYRVDLAKMKIEVFPRELFLESVKEMLTARPAHKTE
jgi:poly(3-hydroxybutyrate) depolymerase